MLLQMRSALHVLCRTSCFLALKLHVLLVGFFPSDLQSIHMVTTMKQCKMRRACFTLYYKKA